jgi:hypothetical protein
MQEAAGVGQHHADPYLNGLRAVEREVGSKMTGGTLLANTASRRADAADFAARAPRLR